MSDKMSEVEAAKNSILIGACRDGECWFNPETGYLEACPEHKSQGMEAMMAKDDAKKLAPLTEDAPSKHEVLLRAAHPNLFVLQEGTMIEVWTHRSPELRTLLALSTPLARALEEAYEHPSVQAYVMTHKASTVGDAPKEIDWTSDEAVVRAAVPGVYQRDASSVWMSEQSRNNWISSRVYKLREAEGYLGDLWKQARQHTIVAAFENEHNPAFKVSSSPVGDLEGRLSLAEIDDEASTILLENGEAWGDWDAKDMLRQFARYRLETRAALSSKPAPESEWICLGCGYPMSSHSNQMKHCPGQHRYVFTTFQESGKTAPEGIPESAEHFLLLEGLADSRAHSSEAIATLMGRYAQAIISAKDAELARLSELLEIEAKLSDKRSYRAEAAEAELASLRASSAKVREEVLREAAAAAVGCYGKCPVGSYGLEQLDSIWNGACIRAEEAILSLLPTSPESDDKSCDWEERESACARANSTAASQSKETEQ